MKASSSIRRTAWPKPNLVGDLVGDMLGDMLGDLLGDLGRFGPSPFVAADGTPYLRSIPKTTLPHCFDSVLAASRRGMKWEYRHARYAERSRDCAGQRRRRRDHPDRGSAPARRLF